MPSKSDPFGVRPLQDGDRVWVTSADGVCETGWWQWDDYFGYWIPANPSSYYVATEYAEELASVLVDFSPTIANYLCMAEQLIASGAMEVQDE